MCVQMARSAAPRGHTGWLYACLSAFASLRTCTAHEDVHCPGRRHPPAMKRQKLPQRGKGLEVRRSTLGRAGHDERVALHGAVATVTSESRLAAKLEKERAVAHLARAQAILAAGAWDAAEAACAPPPDTATVADVDGGAAPEVADGGPTAPLPTPPCAPHDAVDGATLTRALAAAHDANPLTAGATLVGSSAFPR